MPFFCLSPCLRVLHTKSHPIVVFMRLAFFCVLLRFFCVFFFAFFCVAFFEGPSAFFAPPHGDLSCHFGMIG